MHVDQFAIFPVALGGPSADDVHGALFFARGIMAASAAFLSGSLRSAVRPSGFASRARRTLLFRCDRPSSVSTLSVSGSLRSAVCPSQVLRRRRHVHALRRDFVMTASAASLSGSFRSAVRSSQFSFRRRVVRCDFVETAPAASRLYDRDLVDPRSVHLRFCVAGASFAAISSWSPQRRLSGSVRSAVRSSQVSRLGRGVRCVVVVTAPAASRL